MTGPGLHETDRPVVLEVCGSVVLPQQDHERVVEEVEAPGVERPKCVERTDDIVFDDRPSHLVEQTGEAVRSRRAV